MPRNRLQSEVISTRVGKTRGLVASGKVMKPSPEKRYKGLEPAQWQTLCWEFYDTIGEYRYSVNWVGNVLSKASLYAVDVATGERSTNATVNQIVSDLFGGAEYQGEMLRELGIQFTVGGDCYVVAAEGPSETSPDDWYVLSPGEIKQDGVGWAVGEGSSARQLKGNPLVIRMWRPHPRRHFVPDSPSHAVVNILAEIDGLTKHVAAQIDSRLAGAGILVIPDEIDFSSVQTQTQQEEDAEAQVVQNDDSADSFAQQLSDVMSTAIANRASAEALTPLVLQAKGEYLNQIKLITFSTPLDEQSVNLRTEAIRRLALGMDMPPEILTGTGDLNHWSSWQIEEAAIKAHTEPLLAIITSSLTQGFLTPLLEDAGVDPAAFAIAADTSAMRLRPNRSQEALELYDRGELDGNTLRRENGFDTNSSLNKDELIDWLSKKMAISGSPTPEMLNQILTVMGYPIGDVDKGGASDQTKPAQPAPSLEDHPDNSPPDINDAVAASGVMVVRALERAGNRLRNQRRTARATADVKPWNVYLYADYEDDSIPDLLGNSWDCVTEFDLSVKPQWLAARLEKFTADLLHSRKAYRAEDLRSFLRTEYAFSGVQVVE